MENTGLLNSKYHLQELGDTNYEIAKGEPDIRGWEAVSVQNQFIGRVKELVYDSLAEKVRYAVLDLQNNQAQLAPRHVLVPIGMTEVLEENQVVVLSKVSTQQLEALPDYEKGNLNQQVETKVLRVFAGEPSIQIEQNPTIASSGVIGNTQNTETQNNELYPRQVAFDQAFKETDLGSFKEGTIELRERKEIPTLHKTPFVVEEILIGKEVEMHEETIYETIKKTKVSIDNLDSQVNLSNQKTDQAS